MVRNSYVTDVASVSITFAFAMQRAYDARSLLSKRWGITAASACPASPQCQLAANTARACAYE